MSSCSLGCASTLSLRGTILDPGLVTMGSAGTNHDGSSGLRQGCWRWQEAEQGPATAPRRGNCRVRQGKLGLTVELGGVQGCWRRQGSAAVERQGSGGTCSGLLRRAAAVQGRNAGHERGHSALGRLKRKSERN